MRLGAAIFFDFWYKNFIMRRRRETFRFAAILSPENRQEIYDPPIIDNFRILKLDYLFWQNKHNSCWTKWLPVYHDLFLSPLMHIARWANMHRFLYVCPSVRHWTKIHNLLNGYSTRRGFVLPYSRIQVEPYDMSSVIKYFEDGIK